LNTIEYIESLESYQLKSLAKKLGCDNPEILSDIELQNYLFKRTSRVTQLMDIESKAKHIKPFYKDWRFIVPTILSSIGIMFGKCNNDILSSQLDTVNTQIETANSKIEDTKYKLPNKFYLSAYMYFDIPSAAEDNAPANNSKEEEINKFWEDWFFENFIFLHLNIDISTKKYSTTKMRPALQIITKYDIDSKYNFDKYDNNWLTNYCRVEKMGNRIRLKFNHIETTAFLNDGGINSIQEFCGSDIMFRVELQPSQNSDWDKHDSVKLYEIRISTPDGLSMKYKFKAEKYKFDKIKEDSCWITTIPAGRRKQ